MKQLQYILVCGFLLISCICCNVNLNSGLAAHYTFDGNASDRSGNGNNGVIEGAHLTEDRFGNNESAYWFDGVRSAISANVKNLPTINSPLSFSWWFYIDSLPVFTTRSGAQNMIVLANRTEGIGIQVGFRSPGYGTLGFDTWIWGGGTLLQINPPEAKKWYHCVYTFDGSTHRFYINAKEITSSDSKIRQGVPSQLMFGNYPSGNQYFKGKLDDILIYNRTIAESEIGRLYRKGKK